MSNERPSTAHGRLRSRHSRRRGEEVLAGSLRRTGAAGGAEAVLQRTRFPAVPNGFVQEKRKEGKEHTERSQRKIIGIFQPGKYNETHTVCSFCPTPFFSWREVRLPIQSAQSRCDRGFRCLFGRGDYSTHNHAGSCPVEVAASVVSRAFPHPESFRTPPLAAEFSKVLQCPTSRAPR